MGVSFRVVPHHVVLDQHVVEVWVDGAVAGVVYPAGQKGIKIVSAHIEEMDVEEEFGGEVVKDNGSTYYPPIPAVVISFNPSPYTIVGGKIVKQRAH